MGHMEMASQKQYFDVDFEGFSPNNMHGLLYSTFDEKKSPLIAIQLMTNYLNGNITWVKEYRWKPPKMQKLLDNIEYLSTASNNGWSMTTI